MGYKHETMELARERANQIAWLFIKEVERLLDSGAVDGRHHNRGLLFGVALENIADSFLRGERKSSEYKNLKAF